MKQTTWFKNMCLFLAVTLTIPLASAAEMMAIEAGFKWNSASVDGASSTKQVVAFQLGGSAVFPFQGPLALRSGLFYSERPYKAEVGSADSEGKFTYFEVPAQLMYRFEDYAGFYIGPSLALNLSNECTKPSGCSLKSVSSTVIPITIGAAFKFAPQMGVNIFFETVSGDLAKSVGNSRAVGANFMFTFD